MFCWGVSNYEIQTSWFFTYNLNLPSKKFFFTILFKVLFEKIDHEWQKLRNFSYRKFQKQKFQNWMTIFLRCELFLNYSLKGCVTSIIKYSGSEKKWNVQLDPSFSTNIFVIRDAKLHIYYSKKYIKSNRYLHCTWLNFQIFIKMNKISTVHQPVNKLADTDFAKFCGLLRIYEF